MQLVFLGVWTLTSGSNVSSDQTYDGLGEDVYDREPGKLRDDVAAGRV